MPFSVASRVLRSCHNVLWLYRGAVKVLMPSPVVAKLLAAPPGERVV
jgi:hypothetical protein